MCFSTVAVDTQFTNCPLDESIDSMTMRTLRFCHSESDKDTEANTLRIDRGATSLSEEIIEHLVLFILVDYVGCRWHTCHRFVFHMISELQ